MDHITQLKQSCGRALFTEATVPEDQRHLIQAELIAAGCERVLRCELDPTWGLEKLNQHLATSLAESTAMLWPDWLGVQQTCWQKIPAATALLPAWQRQLKENDILLNPTWLKTADAKCRCGQLPVDTSQPLTAQLRSLSACLALRLGVMLIVIDDNNATSANLQIVARSAEWFAAETELAVLLIAAPEQPTAEGFGSLERLRDEVERNDDLSGIPSPPALKTGSKSHSPGEFLKSPVKATGIPDGLGRDPNSQLYDERRQQLEPFEGRPHPGSPGEQLMAAALSEDPLLRSLFRFNHPVITQRGTRYVVDLFWEAGRVVVEIDGYRFHSSRAMFQSDRHRDFELLISGFYVLRLAHHEVVTDIARALNKVRDVVQHVRKTRE